MRVDGRYRGSMNRLLATILGGAFAGSAMAQAPDAGCGLPSQPEGIPAAQRFSRGAAGLCRTHPNVTVTTAAALEGLKFPEKLDLFWISQNYHDFNRAVYSALKPGGVYVILDHSAAPDAPANVTETLHRIESSTVRREVEAAGFKFDSESSILANPADPRTAKVFDRTIRGHTDQFILKFRKPK